MIPSNIKREHIIKAIKDIEKYGVPKGRASRRFQLVLNGKPFPPKYVVSVANKYANRGELDPSEFSGGKETNSFLESRGFKVEEFSHLSKAPAYGFTPTLASNKAGSKSNAKRQREALKSLLESYFGEVQTEASFDWLVVPRLDFMDATLLNLAEALASYRGYREYSLPGTVLHIDFFIPSHNLIIEYDERQHFTISRAIALESYPSNIDLAFDRTAWVSYCKAIRATDPTPYYRDEQRAFYDSLRDILASRHGYTVLRIKDKEYDWTLPDAISRLNKLLGQVVKCACSNIQLQEQTIMSKTAKADAKTRIVSVCVLGHPLENIHANTERQELLQRAIHKIGNRGWSNIDAVVLPGGFFCLDKYLGPLQYAERVAVLENTSFHKVCTGSCQYLSESSPGVIIAIGVDATGRPEDSAYFWPDQLCVAWSEKEIVGIGRKVFPVSPPKNREYREENDESLHYICYIEDYKDINRIVSLANGANAVLCACYDMFGCAENPEESIVTDRTRYIRHIHDGIRLHSVGVPRRPGSKLDYFKVLRTECISSFQRLLKTNNVVVALGAIHRDPSARYWQIHGIQACSAGLDSGLAIGAAHFSQRLPQPNKYILSAYDIPNNYLKVAHKNRRLITPWQHQDWIRNDKLLIRLFEADLANATKQ